MRQRHGGRPSSLADSFPLRIVLVGLFFGFARILRRPIDRLGNLTIGRRWSLRGFLRAEHDEYAETNHGLVLPGEPVVESPVRLVASVARISSIARRRGLRHFGRRSLQGVRDGLCLARRECLIVMQSRRQPSRERYDAKDELQPAHALIFGTKYTSAVVTTVTIAA